MEWVLLPSIARRGFARLVGQQEEIARWSEEARWNRLALDGAGSTGVIAAGVGVGYLLESSDGAPPPYLRLGTWPAPAAMIRRLFEKVDEVLVLEEGYPLLERALRGPLGPGAKRVRGRLDGTLPRTGELDPDSVRAALGRPTLAHAEAPTVPPRPPRLCEGCPHFDSIALVTAIRDEQPATRVFGDIGCYTLAAYPPLSACDTTLCMGASIGMAMGAAQVGMRPVFALIGDSTFTHSGMPALLGAARQDLDLTVLIVDNAAVAMTGCQETLATGDGLAAIVRGLGVDPAHVHVLRAHHRDHEANLALVRREVDHRGLSVIIAHRECVLTPKR